MTDSHNTSASDDASWEQLADRVALGERLSDAERARYEQLRDGDPARAGEDELWEESLAALRQAGGRAGDAQIVAAALEASSPRRPPAAPALGLAVAAAALLTGGFVWLASMDSDDRAGAEQATQAAAPAKPAAVETTRAPAGQAPMRWGEPTARFGTSDDKLARRALTDGCISLRRDESVMVRACVTAGTELRLRGVNESGSTLELRHGEVEAHVFHDKLPAGHRFQVTTQAGSVAAVGTVFRVTVRDGETRASVSEGSVEVRIRDGETKVLHSPAETTLGPSPLPTPAVVAPRSPSPAEHAVPDAQTLHRRAEAARRGGDARAAADHYEALLEHHPDTALARAAMVALADLRLDKLSDPAGALALYRRYASAGGPLVEEAHLGKIRALGELGRPDDQRAAAQQFLERYPNSFHAAAVRRTLGMP